MGDLRARLSDLSAHIVTKDVKKDQPMLRVLFHTGHAHTGHNKRKNVCILVNFEVKCQEVVLILNNDIPCHQLIIKLLSDMIS